MDGPDLITLCGDVNDVVTEFVFRKYIGTQVNQHFDYFVVATIRCVMYRTQTFHVLHVDEVLHSWYFYVR